MICCPPGLATALGHESQIRIAGFQTLQRLPTALQPSST